MFPVTVEKFEGPLDLLLQLIESEKLDICEISLSKITDAYLKKVDQMHGSSEEIADFLVIAAKLLYIKSRELLPDVRTEEEDEEIAELERNLIEYQQYKKAAEELSVILSKNYRSYNRQAKHDLGNLFLPPKDISQEKLMALFQEAVKKLKDKPKEEVIEPIKVTIESKREFVRNHLQKGNCSFRQILHKANSKVEIIVTFLAVLELIRQKEIRADQKGNFGELMLYRLK